MLDLTAEFYLETVQLIFQEYALPLGKLEWHGQRVDPSAIRKTMLLTVEGERDDICAVGQTVAAHDLCSKLRPYLQAPPHAGRRRPLRRVLGQALGRPDLPDPQERDLVERLSQRRDRNPLAQRRAGRHLMVVAEFSRAESQCRDSSPSLGMIGAVEALGFRQSRTGSPLQAASLTPNSGFERRR